MKPNRVFLDELNTTTKAYKVKVKVIEKSRPKTSPTKGTTYQSLVVQDDKGKKMRGALFGDQVEGYKNAFVYNGTYEIANAPIKCCDPQWKRQATDLDFQMSFGSDTIIQPIEAGRNFGEPDFRPISEIPKTSSGDDRYDVIGVVLYMEKTARAIITTQNRETFVREILVLDNCTEQPVTISAWNEFATSNCENLARLIDSPTVVGLTALRSSTYKGFSLTTTVSTTFTASPVGEAAEKLPKWVAQNKDSLLNMQSRIVSVKNTESHKKFKKISFLLQKKSNTTLQEERHWLAVKLQGPDLQKIYAYIGCSNCGKKTEISEGEIHICDFCSKPNSVACPRITLSCEVADDTGVLLITAFTLHAEKLLRLTAAQIFEIKMAENEVAFQEQMETIQNSKHLIQVGPKATLSRNNVLQWVLKKVGSDKDLEEDDAPPKTPTLTSKGGEAGTSSEIFLPTICENKKAKEHSALANTQETDSSPAVPSLLSVKKEKAAQAPGLLHDKCQ